MTELYPSPVPRHSTSPNLPLTAHNIPHNPYPSHSIYPPSNLMQMAPPTTLSNIQPGSPIGNIQNLSQSGIGYNKDNNGNNVSDPNTSQHQGYPSGTTSMVTILGPNSGESTQWSKPRLIFLLQEIATVTRRRARPPLPTTISSGGCPPRNCLGIRARGITFPPVWARSDSPSAKVLVLLDKTR
jgi:hypothetical protein